MITMGFHPHLRHHRPRPGCLPLSYLPHLTPVSNVESRDVTLISGF